MLTWKFGFINEQEKLACTNRLTVQLILFSLFSSVILHLYSSSLSINRVTVLTNFTPCVRNEECCSHKLSIIALNKSLYSSSPQPPSNNTSSFMIISFSNWNNKIFRFSEAAENQVIPAIWLPPKNFPWYDWNLSSWSIRRTSFSSCKTRTASCRRRWVSWLLGVPVQVLGSFRVSLQPVPEWIEFCIVLKNHFKENHNQKI